MFCSKNSKIPHQASAKYCPRITRLLTRYFFIYDEVHLLTSLEKKSDTLCKK